MTMNNSEYHVRVFLDRSELILANGEREVFLEGANSPETKIRYKKITEALESGYLKEQILLCKEEPEKILSNQISEDDQKVFDGLVSSMTSEVGRALIGLSILQLTIKAIDENQSIRLHKGNSSSRSFGWRDGISMRSLDSSYITPVLREYGLVKLNSFGFMMTRTLAENYPYTKVYKAAMRGGREEWLTMVERLETGAVKPLPALHYLLSKLLNNAAKFVELADSTLEVLRKLIKNGNFETAESALYIMRRHMTESNYAARIMEISMHALMQALQEVGALGGATVIPLSQMRSANKKHGNIGDIEILEDGKITISWDAKYGKPYLRDELEELHDKLELHDFVSEAGFVTSDIPSISPEIRDRVYDLEAIHNIAVSIISLDEWVKKYFNFAMISVNASEADIARRWIVAYAESISQKRQQQAPIDEPCYQWLVSLNEVLLRYSIL